ncbi:AAA family ATPase, partial [Aquibium oceanicum]
MHFSRLRLLGFKSFVEPADFMIEGGLTGVVGPNGCGKSNLVEALRWVMGENSYKNMRASGMDDVIFSGSGTRPARNTAEVTLFLDNAERKAPPAWNDADELQVSRRIEREAGSVYRINGKEARAKDVQLLFADQSTGARSPSMVGQGRIGELIQAKPQARRALLEEAAGISGLHSRRHEAELRLRAAEQNLERLDDVTRELEAQIESLKRQARQASRFKNLSSEIRQAEAILLHLRWSQAKAQEAEAQSALSAATSLVGERAQAQMNTAKDQAVGAMKLPELRDAEAAAAAALQRLTIARTQIEEEAERLRARTAELDKRIAQLDADMAREERMVRDNAETLARLSEEEAVLKSEQAGSTDREASARLALEEATQRLAASEAALAKVTAERAEANAARTQFERAVREHSERRTRLDRQLGEARAEMETIAARLSALPDPAEKKRLVEQAEVAVTEAEAAAVASERRVSEARSKEGSLRPLVQETRAALQRIETEARTLAKILNAGSSDLFPAVLEQIKVDRGYETAMGAALGEDLDAPLDRAAPAHWGGIDVTDGDPRLPEGVSPLADKVRAPGQLARRLAQIGIVDKDDGSRLQAMLAPGQRLVSREGAVWRWDGFVAGADAPTAAAQRLAQKNRLAELDQEASAAGAKVREAEAVLAEAEAAVRSLVDAEKAAREAWRAGQRALGAARDELAKAERSAGELATRRAALQEALARIEESRNEESRLLGEAEAALSGAPDPRDLQSAFERQTAIVAQDRSAVAEARAANDGLKREAEARERRLETIAKDRATWISRAENADRQIAALGERRTEAAAEREAMADAPDDLD